jgi:hypothetical protein
MPPKIRHTNTFKTSCKCNEQKNTSIKDKEMPDIGVKGCPLSPTLPYSASTLMNLNIFG